jgi:hypothetical protein
MRISGLVWESSIGGSRYKKEAKRDRAADIPQTYLLLLVRALRVRTESQEVMVASPGGLRQAYLEI